MLCARCQHFAAAQGGTLCAQCAVAEAPPAPAFAGAPGAWLRSPIGLGRAAAAVLGLVIAADLFAAWADVVMLDVSGDIADIADGGFRAYGADIGRRSEDADSLYAAAGVVQAAVLLTSVVVFLCWFHRVRVNAEVFNPFGHRMKRGWAIGGWFTPVVNLWFPRRIALDIWDASSPWSVPRSHGLINAWWTLWLVSLFADRLASSRDKGAETAQEAYDAAGTMLFADALDIVAAALAILVVLRLTRMQHQKALAGPVPATV
ncbi:DUF4328 domain-containing protein [Streptomyces sp. NPDC001982]|uniref:DUF4328 domain-containing protein n=1 Tax=Streptomyces sp. NPDC001982 TaxID=3154405 RepID=UPI00331E53E2